MKNSFLYATLVPLALGAMSHGCNLTEDDAGDVAYVHQVTQTLIGRRPRGTSEIKALLAILEEHGRGTVADVLMAEPDYVDRWLPVLADAMEIQREGQFDVPTQCFNLPSYLTDAAGLAEAQLLATHIRKAPSTSMFDPDGDGVANPWNLNDAMRAALMVDDLQVAWRPYLFVLAGKHGAQAKPVEVRDNFMRTALGVRADCISCHASTYSKTEVYAGYGSNTWDRTAPFGLALETAAFGLPGVLAWPNLPGAPIFAAECANAGCHGESGNDQPPGSPKSLPTRIPLLTDEAIRTQIQDGSDLMAAVPLDDSDTDAVVTFVRRLYGGYPDLQRYLSEAQFDDGNANANVTPWGLSYDCGVEWLADSVTSTRTYAFGGGQESTTDVGDIIRVLRTGLNALPGEAYGDPAAPADAALPRPTAPEAAVAKLLVLNIADDILEELTGSRGSLSHGLSRNVDQAALMDAMATLLLVQDGAAVRVSLKTLLGSIVTLLPFNRRAPHDATSAYGLPMYLNPWAATSDGVQTSDGANVNGQGDVVHRRTPNQLLFSLSKDLGWPAPELDPGGQAAYPTTSFMSKVGRFRSESARGTTVWQLDSLLFWEEQVGPCENPGGGPDYVDALITAATGKPKAKVRDVALALKDRLVQEPVLTTSVVNGTSEQALTQALFEGALGAGTWNALASGYSASPQKDLLESVTRKYCGVLLLSPDYLMANLPTVVVEHTKPVVVACLAGEPCSETALEAHYCATLTSMGLTCP